MEKIIFKLSPKKKYLQIALNNTLEEAYKVISKIPISDRILIEAGTPLIKRYGEEGIKRIKMWYKQRLSGQILAPLAPSPSFSVSQDPLILFLQKNQKAIIKNNLQLNLSQKTKLTPESIPYPYVVADLKMMDRGEVEVELAARAGADGVVALGYSPIESLNAFIQKCEDLGLDAMIDMMNVEYPLNILRQLKKQPRVVILHRGVDEEKFNKEKQIPLHEIRRIKGNYNLLIAIAGGDTLREAQRAIFNDADIVVIWKSVFQNANDTANLVEGFLREIK